MTNILISFLTIGLLLTSIFSITSKNPVISVIFLITTFVLAAGYLIFLGINFIGISYVVIYVGAIAVLFLFVIMMINIKLTDILESGSNYTKNLPLAICIIILFLASLQTILSSVSNPFSASAGGMSGLSNNPLTLSEYIYQNFAYINKAFINFAGNAPWLNTTEVQPFFDPELQNNFLALTREIGSPTGETLRNLGNASDLIFANFEQIEILGHNLYTFGAILLIILSIILLLAMLATIVISKKNYNI